MLTHLSLFTGIGGIDLAAEWAGFETVGQCEWADYPTKVLEKHWPNTPRWRDIHELTAESFYNRTGLRTVDIISGGFPCQPFSVAGNQKGKADDRYLWPEMSRVIRELKPTWVLGENVPGILSIAADDVCKDLDSQGYEVVILNFEAAAVGAKHRRERIFFVADSDNKGLQITRFESRVKTFFKEHRTQHSSENVSDSSIIRLQGQRKSIESLHTKTNTGWQTSQPVNVRIGNKRPTESGLGRVVDGISSTLDGYWINEPDIPRVATGIKNRVDRLKCLGNAVVPAQVYPILQAIADIESSITE